MINKMTSLKVRRKNNLTTCRIVANTLEQCIEKGCRCLKINQSTDFQRVLLEDAVVSTEDYFQSLLADSLLIFECLSDRGTEPIVDLVNNVLKKFRMPAGVANAIVEEARRQAFDSPMRHHWHQSMAPQATTAAETREEDPDWFQSVPRGRRNTKSQVMEDNAKGRIAQYLANANKALVERADLEFEDDEQKKFAKALIRNWRVKLKTEKYYCHYFSRRNRRDDTMCCDLGIFRCEGSHNAVYCKYSHLINPYSSAEEKIVFSIWNLDHQIEKGRTVLPDVIERIKLPLVQRAKINWDYYYSLLFTRRNLKLVYVVCHDKSEHTEATIDETEAVLP